MRICNNLKIIFRILLEKLIHIMTSISMKSKIILLKNNSTEETIKYKHKKLIQEIGKQQENRGYVRKIIKIDSSFQIIAIKFLII